MQYSRLGMLHLPFLPSALVVKTAAVHAAQAGLIEAVLLIWMLFYEYVAVTSMIMVIRVQNWLSAVDMGRLT